MKKILLTLSILLVVCGCKRKTFEEQLVETAQEFTQKQCPREVDEYTVIDSMTFSKEDLTIHYYYTIKGKLDDPQMLTEGVLEDFKESMLSKLRGDIALKKEKEYGVSFAYHYISAKTHESVLEMLFTKDDYRGTMSKHTFNYRETRNMREYTKNNCPVRQDEWTVLDSIWYDSIARTLYYDYSVSGNMDRDSVYQQDGMASALHRELVKAVKESPELETERDKEHLDFAFRYFSASTKNKLIEVTVKNKELEKKN